MRPVLSIVESGENDWDEGAWQAAEQKWIAFYKAAGCNLVNLTSGGEGTVGYVPTAETRARMAAAQTGRKQTPESTAKTAAALRGRKQSPEHIAKLAAVRKGKAPVAATLAAAKAVLGSKQSTDHISKRTAHRKGAPNPARSLSDEQVRAVRMSLLSKRKAAAFFGISPTMVYAIRHRLGYGYVAD